MAAIAGRCEAYKRATASFLDWLALNQPPKARSVRDILTAAQSLNTQGRVLPESVNKNLRNAISLRRSVHCMYEERAQSRSRDDERHFYFIEALESARLLLSAPDISDHTAEPDPSDGPAISKPQYAAIQTDIEALANRFAMLEVEEAADTPDIAVEPPAQKAPSLLVGETVIIEGVASKPELNGRAGRILQYDEGRGRYAVDVDGQQYCLKPSNTRVSPMDIAEEERYLLGETVQFQAACLLLDIEGVLREVRVAWDEHRHGGCSLLEASARTNACVRHAERLASAFELDMPTLDSLERVVCAAYLMRTISWTQSFLKVSFAAALNLVSDITHGIPGDTVLPTLGGTRVIFGVELFAKLVAGLTADQQVVKARAQVRQRVGSVTDAQIGTVLERITEDVTTRIARPPVAESGTLQDPDDFYCGDDGLLLTSAFLRVLSSPSANIVRRPDRWSAPKPGFFGPEWHEDHNPAQCTNDLTDYLGGALPALMYFADGEMRVSKSKRLTMPELKMETLMPLWPLLETAMDKKASTLALVVAVQAMLVSLVCVNGERRCRRVAISTRYAVRKALTQIDHDLAAFTEAATNGCLISERNKSNMEMLRSFVDFTHRRHEHPPLSASASDPMLSAISVRQRDQVLLQNPWVAGQQQLVLSFGFGIGCGSTMLDSAGQTSFALHLQNALRVAGAAEPVPLIDDTLMAVIGGENKAVWFAGVPASNFAKAWYHRLGMASNVKTNRKLTGIEPTDLSRTYCYVAEADFSGLPLIDDANPLPIVLQAITSAFASDQLVGANLTALGTQLAGLPEYLVDKLRLHARLESALADVMSDEHGAAQGKKGRKKGKASNTPAGQADLKARRDALYRMLVAELMFACEREVPDQSEPFHTGAGTLKVDRKDLPRCTPAERAMIEDAGRALKEYMEKIQTTTYRIL